MKKIILSVMISAAMFTTTPILSMETEIEFKGIKKSAVKFVEEGRSAPDEKAFSLTDVMQYEETTGKLKKLSTVADISEESFREISKGNFLYVPYWVTRKHPDMGTYENLGAFIIGTSDQRLIETFFPLIMR